jgi:hypothetical protein
MEFSEISCSILAGTIYLGRSTTANSEHPTLELRRWSLKAGPRLGIWRRQEPGLLSGHLIRVIGG